MPQLYVIKDLNGNLEIDTEGKLRDVEVKIHLIGWCWARGFLTKETHPVFSLRLLAANRQRAGPVAPFQSLPGVIPRWPGPTLQGNRTPCGASSHSLRLNSDPPLAKSQNDPRPPLRRGPSHLPGNKSMPST